MADTTTLDEEIKKGNITFVLAKPDGMANQEAYDEFLERIKKAGLNIAYQETITPEDPQLQQHYSEYIKAPFYSVITNYLKGIGDVIDYIHENINPEYVHQGNIAFIVTGPNAMAIVRDMLGYKDPDLAEEGTIRKKYGHRDESRDRMFNLFHGSDTEEAFKLETKIYVPNAPLEELVSN